MWTSQNRTMIRRNSFYTFVSGRLFSTSSHTDVSQSERLHVEACSGLGRLPTWWALVLTLGVQERHDPKSHISSSKVKFMTNCFTGWVDVYVLFSVWNLCFTVRVSLAFLAWALLMTPNDWIWTIVFQSFISYWTSTNITNVLTFCPLELLLDMQKYICFVSRLSSAGWFCFKMIKLTVYNHFALTLESSPFDIWQTWQSLRFLTLTK